MILYNIVMKFKPYVALVYCCLMKTYLSFYIYMLYLYICLFVFVGVKYVGPNGKVNNMCKAYEAAKYDMIVISDSSILSKY